MNLEQELLKKNSIQALKIAIGSCLAIFIAQMMQLDYAVSAGTIALLSIVTTKWATVKLAITRIISFVVSVGIAYVTTTHISSEWIAFGVFVFSVVIISYCFRWDQSISVNVVSGAHLLIPGSFSAHAIWNELQLVCIGICIAVLLNLLVPNQKKSIVRDIRYAEQRLQDIMEGLALYLNCQQTDRNVWKELNTLERYLERAISRAYEYQDNTWASHPAYYIRYFEMRERQCNLLHSLHAKMRKIRMMPTQAQIIAQYMLYLKPYVLEMNVPTAQQNQLEGIFQQMKLQPLPQDREEFENRAILYHILMDLEEFLWLKKRFIETIDEKQRRIYWG